MLWTKRPIDEDRLEFEAMVRENQGLVHQLRLERLGRTLRARGPVAVRHSRPGFCGDRMTAWLDNDMVLTLKLLRPDRAPIAAISSIQWRDRVGWIIGVRTTRGDEVVLYSWKAKLFLGNHGDRLIAS